MKVWQVEVINGQNKQNLNCHMSWKIDQRAVAMILTKSPENGLLAFESALWLMVKNTFFR